jgi:small-conductance mechanosensitive channel
MQFNFESIMVWAIPVGIVVLGFLLGFFFEWLILSTIKRYAEKTSWKWDDIFVTGFKRAFMWWSTLAAAFIAVAYAPLSPEIEKYAVDAIQAFASLVAIIVMARMAHGFISLMTTSMDGMPQGTLLPNSARVIIYITGVVFILSGMGVNIGPIIGALGVGGLAAALAFKDTLENLFSGFQMLVSRKIRPNDWVAISSGEKGQVVDISWRETTIKDFNNNLIIIPNAKVSSSIITNFNLPYNEIYAEVLCGVGYDSDLEHVEKVVKDLAIVMYKKVFDKDYVGEPTFLFLEFGDSAINFKLKVMVDEFGQRWKFIHPMIKALHKKFGEEGIDIPFPIRTIYSK